MEDRGDHGRRRVAVLDASGGVTTLVRRALPTAVWSVERVPTWDTASRLLHRAPPNLLVLSMCLPSDMGRTLPPWPVRGGDSPPLLFLAGCVAMELAARTLFPTATVLPFPLAPEVLRETCEAVSPRGAAYGDGPDCASGAPGAEGVVGRSPGMLRVREQLARVVATDATVLLIGETGTGKELIAGGIHRLSGRAGPFVPINCVGLADGVLESELFGHARGAFTGAQRSRPGLFEAARGGTVLLDEIADAPEHVQARLLRVLQEREVRRVGESRARPLDIRVIATTQRDLGAEVAAGRFREDLYYRLKVFEIALPPLRDRRGDIPLLVDHWLERHGGRQVTRVAMAVLQAHDWPGNVRELWASLEAAAVRADGGVINLQHLDEHLRAAWLEQAWDRKPSSDDGSPVEQLLDVLEETNGNRTRAAELLGISRTTLWRRLRTLDP